MLIARFEGHLSVLSLKSLMMKRGRVFETLQVSSILTYPNVLTLVSLTSLFMIPGESSLGSPLFDGNVCLVL